MRSINFIFSGCRLRLEYSLLDKEDSYKTKMQEIIHRRLHALWDNTGFTLVEDPLRAGYYSEIDMLVLRQAGNHFVVDVVFV